MFSHSDKYFKNIIGLTTNIYTLFKKEEKKISIKINKIINYR
jgi:hypothetical protein